MFAILPIPTGGGRERRQELIYSFEAQLPVSIEQLQMAFAESESGVVACACPKDVLEPYRAHAERAIPAALPDWLGNSEHDALCSRLNLLTGSLKPHRLIQRRNNTLKITSGSLILIAALFSLGVANRVWQLNARTSEIQSDTQALYDSILPPASSGSAQPDPIRFATIMNQLTATRTGASEEHGIPLIPELASILSDWPRELQAQVRSISLDKAGVRIESSMPDNAHATGLLEYIRSRKQLDILSHQMSPSADRVDLRMQLERVPSTGGRTDEE